MSLARFLSIPCKQRNVGNVGHMIWWNGMNQGITKNLAGYRVFRGFRFSPLGASLLSLGPPLPLSMCPRKKIVLG